MNRNQNLKNSVLILLAAFAFLFTPFKASGETKNGFDISNAIVDQDKILRGGPPRDGIPSIDNPNFIPADKVNYLNDTDIVVSLRRDKTVRAYPTRILVWHEIVNDSIEGEKVAVTYCPLCGTAMVFNRIIDGKTKTFGVSGLLYNSDVLMYDRESESLWSQLGLKAVSGPETGKKLTWLPSEHMTWESWKNKYPNGEVLSINTGYSRNYGGEAYRSYFESDRTMFPVPHTRRELSNKEWVLGVIVDGKAKAYPIKNFKKEESLKDRIGKKEITVSYDSEKKHPEVTTSEGKTIPSVMVFWFAWQAFYPDTELWDNQQLKGSG